MRTLLPRSNWLVDANFDETIHFCKCQFRIRFGSAWTCLFLSNIIVIHINHHSFSNRLLTVPSLKMINYSVLKIVIVQSVCTPQRRNENRKQKNKTKNDEEGRLSTIIIIALTVVFVAVVAVLDIYCVVSILFSFYNSRVDPIIDWHCEACVVFFVCSCPIILNCSQSHYHIVHFEWKVKTLDGRKG